MYVTAKPSVNLALITVTKVLTKIERERQREMWGAE